MWVNYSKNLDGVTMKEYRTEQDSLVLLSTPAHNGRKAEPSALRANFVSVTCNGWLDWVKAKPGSQGPARNANPFLDVIVYCHLHLSCRDLYRTKDESVDLSMEFLLSVLNDLKFHFFSLC